MPKKTKVTELETTDIRSRIIVNATKTGDGAFPPTTMAFALVAAALRAPVMA